MVKRAILRQSILFLKHVVPATVKPARTLWNEIIGFLFIVFAVIAASAAARAALRLKEDPRSLVELLIIVPFACVMTWYGIASFRKARRISRS